MKYQGQIFEWKRTKKKSKLDWTTHGRSDVTN